MSAAVIAIPGITSPLGRYWHQPDTRQIVIDEKHAAMTTATFEGLAECSASNPTGVYSGKMWRRHDGVYDANCKPEDCRWLLCWYGPAKEQGFCIVNYREILIVGDGSSRPCQEEQ